MPSAGKRRRDVCGRSGGDRSVLFYPGLLPHGQHRAQHRVGDHQLSGRLPDLPEKPLFCAGPNSANDLVLIVLWTLASASDIRYISVVVCFAAFFANDLYGYINWQKMKVRQAQAC